MQLIHFSQPNTTPQALASGEWTELARTDYARAFLGDGAEQSIAEDARVLEDAFYGVKFSEFVLEDPFLYKGDLIVLVPGGGGDWQAQQFVRDPKTRELVPLQQMIARAVAAER